MPTALIVDDAPVIRCVLGRLMVELGFATVDAANGREALQQLDAMADPVDLMLVDWNMPEMDGLEATRRLRKRSDGAAKTPVVALTAHAFEDVRKQCLDAGMNGFLTKPISKAELFTTLDKQITHRP